MAADGQVTMGDIVMKHHARKLRPLAGGKVLVGFAGATADGLTLVDRLETQLERHSGGVRRAAIELAKDWRTDRYLRRLEAQLLVADVDGILLVSGDGDVIEPDEDVASIGSGGPYAQSAATALIRHTNQTAEEIVRAAMAIASSLCIYTNSEIITEVISNQPSVFSSLSSASGDQPEDGRGELHAPLAVGDQPPAGRGELHTPAGAGDDESAASDQPSAISHQRGRIYRIRH